MRRVQQIDLTAIKLIQQIASRLQKNGGALIFCNVHKGIGIGKKVQKALQKASSSNVTLQISTFNGKDEALEFAENSLLEELGSRPTECHYELQLKDNDLCHSLTADELDNLASVITIRQLKSGTTLFKKGDFGDEIFMVSSGQIDIRLPTTKHHYKRLATCRPGFFFGELALLNPGPRVADAVATHETKLFILSREGLDTLQKSSPDTAVNLLITLAKIQVNYLRWSTLELQHLSEW
jgi:SulP family sulfate permease